MSLSDDGLRQAANLLRTVAAQAERYRLGAEDERACLVAARLLDAYVDEAGPFTAE